MGKVVVTGYVSVYWVWEHLMSQLCFLLALGVAFNFLEISHFRPELGPFDTRKGWCPRTWKGQWLMGILAVTGSGSVVSQLSTVNFRFLNFQEKSYER